MKARIRFFTENVPGSVRGKRKLAAWFNRVLEGEGKAPGDINIVLCDDIFLADLNLKYLKHKTLTDILTFPFEEESGHICGDIYISQPRVIENAEKFQQDPEMELHRVMIHGILHLAGYRDKTPGEKKLMREAENRCLAMLDEIQ